MDIPVGVCRYCLKPEHHSGTMCPRHPDFIPNLPVGCDGPFPDAPGDYAKSMARFVKSLKGGDLD